MRKVFSQDFLLLPGQSIPPPGQRPKFRISDDRITNEEIWSSPVEGDMGKRLKCKASIFSEESRNIFLIELILFLSHDFSLNLLNNRLCGKQFKDFYSKILLGKARQGFSRSKSSRILVIFQACKNQPNVCCSCSKFHGKQSA